MVGLWDATDQAKTRTAALETSLVECPHPSIHRFDGHRWPEHPLERGGIYLFALANLAPGDEIRIEYPASESDEPLSRSGVVRNRAIYLYGIEFSADQQQSNCLYDQ